MHLNENAIENRHVKSAITCYFFLNLKSIDMENNNKKNARISILQSTSIIYKRELYKVGGFWKKPHNP